MIVCLSLRLASSYIQNINHVYNILLILLHEVLCHGKKAVLFLRSHWLRLLTLTLSPHWNRWQTWKPSVGCCLNRGRNMILYCTCTVINSCQWCGSHVECVISPSRGKCSYLSKYVFGYYGNKMIYVRGNKHKSWNVAMQNIIRYE